MKGWYDQVLLVSYLYRDGKTKSGYVVWQLMYMSRFIYYMSILKSVLVAIVSVFGHWTKV